MSGPALALLTVLATASASPPPSPTRWVDDGAGMMTPASRDALDARLESYDHATGHQVVVWTGKTLGGQPLDDWSVRTFAAWKVGRAGLDDGIAMFVFADDHAIDIEVGYGLEDKVPDAIASRVIREVMAPRLRAGDADGAVTAGTEAILAAIEGHPWSATGAVPAPPPDDGTSVVTWIFGILVGIVLLVVAITHPRAALWILWAVFRQGGGGGGGGGGDGGGFSGGGGRSGGGGARGGW